MAARRKSTARRSSYSRSSYEKNRKKRLNYARNYYKKHAAKIKAYQKKYRRRTGAGSAKYKPLYARGAKTGKRPLFARLPRMNVYRFITRRKGKTSHALGRKSASFRRGRGSNVGRRPVKGGARAFRKSA